VRFFVVSRESVPESLISQIKKLTDEVVLITQNITDMELWRKLSPSSKDVVILLLPKDDALVISSFLRKVLGFGGIILALLGRELPERSLSELGVHTLSVPSILLSVLRSLVRGKGLVRYPVGIGLGKGELAEVLITESSPAVGLRLKDLRQRGVRVCLVYRGERVILPKSSLRIEVSDRLLVAGLPGAVELFVKTTTEGEPNFPLEWGSVGIYCEVKERADEFNYVKETLKVKEWRENCSGDEDVGIAVFGKKREGLFGNDYLKRAFREGYFPSLFLQGTHPYRDVLLSANTDVLFSVLPDAIDFSRTVRARLHILLVKKPQPMEDEEERKLSEELLAFVKRAKKTGTPDVSLIIREGNPVRETIRTAKEGFNLLIVGYTLGKTGSFLFPYAPYLIARASPLSLLLIPSV